MRTTLLGSALATLAVAGALALTTGDDAAPRRAAAVPELPPAAAGLDARVRALQATVRLQPQRVEGHTLLASAYLDKLRETGDDAFKDRAQREVRTALSLAPRDPGALVEHAALLLNAHFFPEGLAAARRARQAAPHSNRPFGVLVDGLIETGRYREAGRVLQVMADRKPDVAALTRVSYYRELRGDVDGAVDALHRAASAGAAAGESAAFVQSLIGDLELLRDNRAAARRAYRTALARRPGHASAQQGLARLDLAAGHHERAVSRLRALSAREPSPGVTLALAEATRAAGRDARALLRRAVAEEQEAAATEGVPQELAAIEADHGSPRRALRAAREAWREAPSVASADAMGWALTRSGRADAGLRWARRALRLGSGEPRFLYHAGVAALKSGDEQLGRRWLRAALEAPLRLSPSDEQDARRRLSLTA